MSDSVITGYGNPLYRFEDLLMRRRLAALAGQHRVVQRFTKQLNIFRAAFGLPTEDDEPTNEMRNHKVARDLNEDTSLAAMVASLSEEPQIAGVPRSEFVASLAAAEKMFGDECEVATEFKFDRDWMKMQTASGIAHLVEEVASSPLTRKREGEVFTYAFDTAKGRVELAVANNLWCASVTVGGISRPLASYRSDAEDVSMRGVPASMASDEWDGCLSSAEAQSYSHAWVDLAREIKA